MPSAPGSSCVGIPPLLQAHLVLDKTLRRLTTDAPLWLSAVVLEELYAGTADRDRQVVERLERDFDRAKRILVPNLSDWTQADRVLARLAAMHLTTQRAVYVLDVNATLDKALGGFESQSIALVFGNRQIQPSTSTESQAH